MGISDTHTVAVFSDRTIIIGSSEAGPQGPPGIPCSIDQFLYIGPTPPANTSLLWVDTS